MATYVAERGLLLLCLVVFIVPAKALKCHSCLGNEKKCKLTEVTCSGSNDTCGSSVMVIKSFPYKERMVTKGCVSSTTPYRSISISPSDIIKMSLEEETCGTDLCNKETIPESEDKVNELSCYSCVSPGKDCNSDTMRNMNCRGQQNKCLDIRVLGAVGGISNTNFKGCGNVNCSNSMIFANKMSSVFVKCCNENFCNSEIDFREPDKKPNGVQCYSCNTLNGENCRLDNTTTTECYGNLTACFELVGIKTGDGKPTPAVLKGCATPNMCDSFVLPLLQNLRSPRMKCCNGSLCNKNFTKDNLQASGYFPGTGIQSYRPFPASGQDSGVKRPHLASKTIKTGHHSSNTSSGGTLSLSPGSAPKNNSNASVFAVLDVSTVSPLTPGDKQNNFNYSSWNSNNNGGGAHPTSSPSGGLSSVNPGSISHLSTEKSQSTVHDNVQDQPGVYTTDPYSTVEETTDSDVLLAESGMPIVNNINNSEEDDSSPATTSQGPTKLQGSWDITSYGGDKTNAVSPPSDGLNSTTSGPLSNQNLSTGTANNNLGPRNETSTDITTTSQGPKGLAGSWDIKSTTESSYGLTNTLGPQNENSTDKSDLDSNDEETTDGNVLLAEGETDIFNSISNYTEDDSNNTKTSQGPKGLEGSWGINSTSGSSYGLANTLGPQNENSTDKSDLDSNDVETTDGDVLLAEGETDIFDYISNYTEEDDSNNTKTSQGPKGLEGSWDINSTSGSSYGLTNNLGAQNENSTDKSDLDSNDEETTYGNVLLVEGETDIFDYISIYTEEDDSNDTKTSQGPKGLEGSWDINSTSESSYGLISDSSTSSDSNVTTQIILGTAHDDFSQQDSGSFYDTVIYSEIETVTNDSNSDDYTVLDTGNYSAGVNSNPSTAPQGPKLGGDTTLLSSNNSNSNISSAQRIPSFSSGGYGANVANENNCNKTSSGQYNCSGSTSVNSTESQGRSNGSGSAVPTNTIASNGQGVNSNVGVGNNASNSHSTSSVPNIGSSNNTMTNSSAHSVNSNNDNVHKTPITSQGNQSSNGTVQSSGYASKDYNTSSALPGNVTGHGNHSSSTGYHTGENRGNSSNVFSGPSPPGGYGNSNGSHSMPKDKGYGYGNESGNTNSSNNQGQEPPVSKSNSTENGFSHGDGTSRSNSSTYNSSNPMPSGVNNNGSNNGTNLNSSNPSMTSTGGSYNGSSNSSHNNGGDWSNSTVHDPHMMPPGGYNGSLNYNSSFNGSGHSYISPNNPNITSGGVNLTSFGNRDELIAILSNATGLNTTVLSQILNGVDISNPSNLVSVLTSIPEFDANRLPPELKTAIYGYYSNVGHAFPNNTGYNINTVSPNWNSASLANNTYFLDVLSNMTNISTAVLSQRFNELSKNNQSDPTGFVFSLTGFDLQKLPPDLRAEFFGNDTNLSYANTGGFNNNTVHPGSSFGNSSYFGTDNPDLSHAGKGTNDSDSNNNTFTFYSGAPSLRSKAGVLAIVFTMLLLLLN